MRKLVTMFGLTVASTGVLVLSGAGSASAADADLGVPPLPCRHLVAGVPAAAVGLVAVLGAAEWQSAFPATGRAPDRQVLGTPVAEGSISIASAPPVERRQVAPVHPSARPPAPWERAAADERVIVAVPGPAGTGVGALEGDTGGGEEGPVEVIEACLERLELTPEHVGC